MEKNFMVVSTPALAARAFGAGCEGAMPASQSTPLAPHLAGRTALAALQLQW